MSVYTSKKSYGPGIVPLEVATNTPVSACILRNEKEVIAPSADGIYRIPEGTQATLIENAEQGKRYNIQVVVENGASLIYRIECSSISYTEIIRKFHVHELASVQLLAMYTRADAVKSHTEVYLEGDEASCVMHSYAENTNTSIDLFESSYHNAINTTAEIYHRAVGREKSKEIYRASITIQEGATGANAQQQAKIMLVDSTARIDAIPLLDISCPDVSCSHAVSVSKPTDEELFYLQSRGVEKEQAIETIIDTFLSPYEL